MMFWLFGNYSKLWRAMYFTQEISKIHIALQRIRLNEYMTKLYEYIAKLYEYVIEYVLRIPHIYMHQ